VPFPVVTTLELSATTKDVLFPHRFVKHALAHSEAMVASEPPAGAGATFDQEKSIW